jgi:hypothetical protein
VSAWSRPSGPRRWRWRSASPRCRWSAAFAAHWCPHCQREIPLLSNHLRSEALPAGVDLVTIATGTNPDAPNYPPSSWLEANPLPGRVLVDSAASDTGRAFGLPGYPYFVALDRDGRVAARASGEIGIAGFKALIEEASSN